MASRADYGEEGNDTISVHTVGWSMIVGSLAFIMLQMVFLVQLIADGHNDAAVMSCFMFCNVAGSLGFYVLCVTPLWTVEQNIATTLYAVSLLVNAALVAYVGSILVLWLAMVIVDIPSGAFLLYVQCITM